MSVATLTATTAHTQTLSGEQLAIVSHVDDGAGHFIVRARAGTGKTFLIIQCLTLMRGQIAILAYNRKISSEIKHKVAKAGHRGVDVSTFHGIGDRIIRSVFKNAKLEGKGKGAAGYFKFDRIAEELQIPKYLLSFVRKLTGMAMQHGAGVPGLMSAKDQAAWRHLVSHYGIDSEIADDNVIVQVRGREFLILEGMRFAYQALNLSKKMLHEVYSFDEMLWGPVILNAKFPTYDWVCVDEAQDTNPIRREMAHRMMHARTRSFWVGDDKQAINGWNGADNDALDLIERKYACRVFPMTTTFRCAKAIVELARTLVPDYRAAPGNPQGTVSSIDEANFEKMTLVPGEDAIICRNTRPLVKVAYGLIRRGIPAHIEGKDIGKGLIALIGRFPHIKNLSVLTGEMERYRDREVKRLSDAGQDMVADALIDKVEAVLAVIEGMPAGSKADDLRQKIDSMFADTVDGDSAKTVTLMTAHRSKGLEFKRVFGFGRATYMPSKRAKQEHELQQEANLEYVLISRGIETYIDVMVSA